MHRSQLLEEELKELRSLQDKLRKSESRLREAEAISHLGHWELNLSTNKLIWSDEIYRIFNLEPQEFAASYEAFLERIHPDDRDTVDSAYMQSVKSHTDYEITHRLLLPDGTIKHVHERGNTDYSADGMPLRSFGTVLDITGTVRLEQELFKSQKLESLGMLSGGIAHDFNNILTALLGNLDLAAENLADDSPIKALLDEAVRAAMRASGLTRQLLTFAKGGAPVKEVTDVSKVIHDSASFALTGSASRCQFDLPDGLWLAMIDAGLVSQVIQNLVINAAEAMPEGGVVRVSCHNHSHESSGGDPMPSGDFLRIDIRDTGAGISPNVIDQIFDPFFTTKSSGSGLGLSISHSIVANHGGRVTVSSGVGDGSCFTILLPASPHGHLPDTPSSPEIARGKGHILLMDDEQAVRRVVTKIIDHCGYRIETAGDGHEAIEIFRSAQQNGDPFDVVILDLTVPGAMGGKQAHEQLRQLDPDVKTIVSSGYSSDPLMADHARHGFAAAIRKPYLMHELATLLKRVIG